MKNLLLSVTLLSTLNVFAAETACIDEIKVNDCQNVFVANEANTGAVEAYLCSAEINLNDNTSEYVEGVRTFEPTKMTEDLIEKIESDKTSGFVKGLSKIGMLVIEVPRAIGRVAMAHGERHNKIEGIVEKHGFCDPDMTYGFDDDTEE